MISFVSKTQRDILWHRIIVGRLLIYAMYSKFKCNIKIPIR